jgi:hypothetical protein
MVKVKRKEVKYAVWRWNRTNGTGTDDGKGSRFLRWLWWAWIR